MLYTYAIILFAFISFIYVERKNLCASPIYLSSYLPTLLYIYTIYRYESQSLIYIDILLFGELCIFGSRNAISES